MTPTKALLMAEDLLNLPDDGCFYELLDGVLVEIPPPGATHGNVSGNVCFVIKSYVKQPELGYVLSNDPGVILHRDPDRVRAPDVCFIARERVSSDSLPDGYLEFVPDLIIEVISPSDRAGDVQAKIDEWLAAGAHLAWAVYPSARRVVVFTSDGAARVYGVSDTLTGAPVLLDFSVAVADLFS
jgi:Uma2 family endonuclease